MAEARKKGLISHGVAAQNRKARFDYTIKDTVEAGLVLKGPEVKSLRHGRATLTEAWAGERDGEMWLFNAYIPEYQGGVLSRFEPRAPRKLLLKKKQIVQLLGAVAKQGATLVPLQIHFNDQGRAKVLLGVGKGRQKQDKRAGDQGPRLEARQGAADESPGVGGASGTWPAHDTGARSVPRSAQWRTVGLHDVAHRRRFGRHLHRCLSVRRSNGDDRGLEGLLRRPTIRRAASPQGWRRA